MMNLDGARAGDGIQKNPEGPTSNEDGVGITDPVFSSQEKKLNYEVPDGWSVLKA